jgi:hypothetical protein
MKKLISLMIILGFSCITSNIVYANHVATAAALASTGGTTSANPERRRVAGAALIMEAEGLINEPSIPMNTIKPTAASVPQNTIMEGTPEGMDAPLKQELIVQ